MKRWFNFEKDKYQGTVGSLRRSTRQLLGDKFRAFYARWTWGFGWHVAIRKQRKVAPSKRTFGRNAERGTLRQLFDVLLAWKSPSHRLFFSSLSLIWLKIQRILVAY